MKALFLFLALPNIASATTMNCVIDTKCGASGMCVQTHEKVTITEGEDIAVSGLPGLSNPDALRLREDGSFELRPPKSAFNEDDTDFDRMAVRFAGHCDPAGETK